MKISLQWTCLIIQNNTLLFQCSNVYSVLFPLQKFSYITILTSLFFQNSCSCISHSRGILLQAYLSISEVARSPGWRQPCQAVQGVQQGGVWTLDTFQGSTRQQNVGTERFKVDILCVCHGM